jgi:hypothetical protein
MRSTAFPSTGATYVRLVRGQGECDGVHDHGNSFHVVAGRRRTSSDRICNATLFERVTNGRFKDGYMTHRLRPAGYRGHAVRWISPAAHGRAAGAGRAEELTGALPCRLCCAGMWRCCGSARRALPSRARILESIPDGVIRGRLARGGSAGISAQRYKELEFGQSTEYIFYALPSLI